MNTLRILTILLVMAIILSACGLGGNSPDGRTQSNTTSSATPTSNATASQGAVTIGFAAPEFERRTYEPLIEAFNAQNTDIQIQFVSTDALAGAGGAAFFSDETTRQTVSAADTAAVFFLQPEAIANGYVRDLAPLMEADTGFDRNDFYPGALGSTTQEGVYLLPQTLTVPLLAYNKALWTASGLPEPTNTWSATDLLAAAEQLARKRGDTVEVYGFMDWSNGLQPLLAELATQAADLFTTAPESIRLDQTAVETALERVAALVDTGAIYSSSEANATVVDPTDFNNLILGQQVAMWPAELLQLAPDQTAPFEIGFVPFPTIPEVFAPGATGYIMSSGTQHPQEAWRWLEFLSQQELNRGGMMFFGGGVRVPARQSVAEQSGFWSELDSARAAALRVAMERQADTATPRLAEALIQPLTQALQAVVQGESTGQALAAAQATLADQIAQAQLNPSPTPANKPIVVELPVEAVAPPEATKIRFVTPGLDTTTLRRLASQFNQQNPNFFVEVENANWGGVALGLADVASTADCFAWPVPPQTDEITATLDLRPLIDADPSFDQADYPTALLASFSQGTALYGLPHGVSLRALHYNQTAFDAAGLEYPNPNWTLDDVRAAAEQLTLGSGDEIDQYGFASNISQTDDVLFFLRQSGAAITTGSADALQANFTDERVIAALSQYLDLLRKNSPHQQLQGYRSASNPGIQTFTLVNTGRVGMWLDFGGRSFIINAGGPETPAFTTALAPPPLGATGATADDLRISGLYISAATEQPQACWEWISFLSRELTSLPIGFDFPARRSLADSEAFAAQAQPGAAAVYAAYSAALSRPDEGNGATPLEQSMIDLFWFFQAVDRALQSPAGEAEQVLERELAEAQRLTSTYLDCVNGGGGAKTCATQADPNYAGLAED
ncbi:MAG: extracellular solute-binding protein [Chloroflexales bacterium]|nr:extracellular solute-binding protein [Chloroflexales bacterium]